jgi:hypothetical protein
MGVERALKSHVFDHVSLFSLANLPARGQTRAISTFHPLTSTVQYAPAVKQLFLSNSCVLGGSPPSAKLSNRLDGISSNW